MYLKGVKLVGTCQVESGSSLCNRWVIFEPAAIESDPSRSLLRTGQKFAAASGAVSPVE